MSMFAKTASITRPGPEVPVPTCTTADDTSSAPSFKITALLDDDPISIPNVYTIYPPNTT